jgi:hypothetical protein
MFFRGRHSSTTSGGRKKRKRRKKERPKETKRCRNEFAVALRAVCKSPAGLCCCAAVAAVAGLLEPFVCVDVRPRTRSCAVVCVGAPGGNYFLFLKIDLFSLIINAVPESCRGTVLGLVFTVHINRKMSNYSCYLPLIVGPNF